MSPENLSDDRRAALERLRACSALIWEFMAERSDLVRNLAEEALTAIDGAYTRGDLRALRLAVRDNVEWIGSLSEADQQEIKRLLRERVGFDVDLDLQDRRKSISAVIRRGHIRNDDEFRLVRGYLDGTPDDLSQRESERLAAILAQYEGLV